MCQQERKNNDLSYSSRNTPISEMQFAQAIVSLLCAETIGHHEKFITDLIRGGARRSVISSERWMDERSEGVEDRKKQRFEKEGIEGTQIEGE
jgi:hypothetical protein